MDRLAYTTPTNNLLDSVTDSGVNSSSYADFKGTSTFIYDGAGNIIAEAGNGGTTALT
jgi:hypothetical protein